MQHLTLQLLGEVEACTASTTAPVVFPTKKSKALLAYLAVTPGRRHSREKLASLFWDVSDSRARVNLRQTLTRLRKSLCHSRHACVLGDGDTLWIDSASINVDVFEFEQLCEEGTPRALQRAVKLYSGEFLEDFTLDQSAFEEWLELERTRLRERAIEAMTMLLNHHLGSDDAKGGISIGCRLLGIDPFQEHVHRALMRLYLAQGRRQSALKQYQACRELLDRELGISPDAETEALYRQVQEQGATLLPVAPPPIRAIDSDRCLESRALLVRPSAELQQPTGAPETYCEIRRGNRIHIRMAFSCEMSINTNRLADGLRSFSMTTFGLILAAIPLALWIAWSGAVFFAVLAVGTTVMLLLSVLASLKKSTDKDQCERPESRTIDRLSDQVLAELSSLGPYNRRLGDPAFQRNMDSLLRRMSDTDGR
jgi:DNA-binding SARP family transcriptional activator